jgi:hypothetical protein
MMAETKKICPSTHGEAGYDAWGALYAPGSYIRLDGKVVCGACGLAFDALTTIPPWVPREKPRGAGNPHC